MQLTTGEAEMGAAEAEVNVGGGGWVNNYTFKQNYHSNGVKLSRSTRTY